MIVRWAGHDWTVRPLPATAASTVARLAVQDHATQREAAVSVAAAAGITREQIVDAIFDSAPEDDVDLLGLVAALLEADSALPWPSTVGMCRSTVQQWSTIRGRLISKGIADPLAQIGTLSALVDVVVSMMMESFVKDEEREKFQRDLYHRPMSGSPDEPPPGWEDGADLVDFD